MVGIIYGTNSSQNIACAILSLSEQSVEICFDLIVTLLMSEAT